MKTLSAMTCFLLGSLFLCEPGHAYTDVLDTPALKAKASQYNLLLDVEQAGNRLVVVGERGHILYTDDQGHNWIQAEVPSRAFLTAVHFPSPQKGWAVGQDTIILHSENGGQTWSRQYDNRDSSFPAALLDVFFLNEEEGFVIGSYGKFLHTTDGGENWEDWREHIDNLDEWHLNAFTQASDGVLYIAGEAGFIYLSHDNGQNWQALNVPIEVTFVGAVASRQAEVVVVFGIGGKVFVTRDSGNTWQEVVVETDAGLSGGRLLDDGSIVIVGSSGVVLKADAEAKNFRVTNTASMLPLSSVIDGENDTLILVGLGGIELMSAATSEEAGAGESN